MKITASKKLPHPWLFILLLVYVALLVRIFLLIDPWQENLTGLPFLYGRMDLLVCASFLNSFLIVWSTWLLWSPLRSIRDKLLMVFSMFLCFGASLIPYQPEGFWLNDFHVWLYVLGYLLYLALWLMPFLVYHQPMTFCLEAVLISYGMAAVFFAVFGQVIGIAEILPMIWMTSVFVARLESWI